MTSIRQPVERFVVTYQVTCLNSEIENVAREICYEQTVEIDPVLVTQPNIRDFVVGRVERIRPSVSSINRKNKSTFFVEISYWDEITAFQIPQLLSVIMGNSSLKRGIRVVDVVLNNRFFDRFRGPRFGIDGIRKLLGVYDRPLLSCPLKPMGLSAGELGQLTKKLVMAGVDIIKDDHGLVDHGFCSFEERLHYCHESLMQACHECNRKALYFVSITDHRMKMQRAIKLIKSYNRCGILLSPYLTGLDFVHEYISSNKNSVPIMLHPSFIGSSFNDPNQGFHPAVLLGTFLRLIGGDAVIFPTFGGRFHFSRDDCVKLTETLTGKFGPCKPVFPVPAGGIRLDDFPALHRFYGNDAVFLIGSNLFKQSADIRKSISNAIARLSLKILK